MNNLFFDDKNKQQTSYTIGIFWKISILTFALFFVTYFHVIGQAVSIPQSINLRSVPLSFTLKEFYISDIIDERVNRKVVGYLLPANHNTSQPTVTQPVDLNGGGLYAIRQFVKQSLPQDTKLRPVIIRLKECIITESPVANGRVEGRVVVSMHFDLKRDDDTVHLLAYEGGGAQYNRAAGQYTAVEQALRQSLGSALRYFNNWINQEAPRSEKLAKGIKVFFKDYTQNIQDDTVFYAVNRPLIWDDFREKPRLSRYAASVFPSFSYEGNSKIVKGLLHLNLTLKVYVLKNASWVKDAARDAYSLNHEQRHFDIVKIVAERFKQKIHPDSLTIEDHNSIIQYHYIESFREMNRLQEQYDEETRHGLDQVAQEAWNRRIDEDLRSFAVKE